MIAAGRVTVAGAPALKPTRQVSAAEPIIVSGPPPRFVSRAGHKLDAALDEFGIDPHDRHALDIGSSTGGFTDCLLQRGAATVVAIDVGSHQLHERLRADDRVLSMENTHILHTTISEFSGTPWRADGFGVVVADLSFISTTAMLGHLRTFLAPPGDLIVLVKPQFEAGREEVAKGRGIVRDPTVWRRVLHSFIDEADAVGLEPVDLAISPVIGGKGNVEFLAHLRHGSILGSVNAESSGSAVERNRD